MSKTFALVLVSVFLAAAFAGCVKDDANEPPRQSTPKKVGAVDPSVYIDVLSPEKYPEVVKEHVPVASFDGKIMDTWVFRPKTPDDVKVPIFINFSPYWANNPPTATAESGGDAFSHYMIDHYVPRGYAIALSSARGTGFSEGCFNIGGETEKKDSYAVIDALSKLPWTNGNLMAGAKSYDGTMANGVATLAHPALKAIFPVEPISELYLYSYKGGIAYRPTFSTTYFQSESTTQTWNSQPTLIAEDAACPDLAGHTAGNFATGVTGDDDAYWLERNYTKDGSKYKGATFYVQGFNDWNVKPDSIDLLNTFSGPKIAYLHNWTQGGTGHVYPMREDWNLTMLRFMDQTLKGIETGIFDEPPFHVQDSEGMWHWETEWPPARAVPTRLYMGFDGGKPALGGSAFRGGVRTFQDNGAGPSASATTGTNFVRYESPVLVEDLRYSGTPTVHLQASTNDAVGKVVVSLIDVAPDGSGKVINWGGLNMRHRQSVQDPQPVTPNQVYDLVFPLFPQDDVVRAGHKVAVVVSGGNVAGGTGGGFGFMSYPWQNTITINEGEQAFVELPVITTADWEEPQPIPVTCFTC